MASLIDLQFSEPITDSDGRASEYFLRYLYDRGGFFSEAEQNIATLTARQIIAGNGLDGGGVIGDGDITIDANASDILDLISSTRGTVLYRGAAEWAALAPGTAGHFLKTNGAGADPAWAAASGGGTGWTLLHSWDQSVDGNSSGEDVDVTGRSEVLVIGRAITLASSGFRGVFCSVDGGASFYNTTGNYVVLNLNGTETSTFIACNHGTATTAARNCGGILSGLDQTSVPKLLGNMLDGGQNRLFVASDADDVDFIRVGAVASSAGAFISMTGGKIWVFAR